jgi:hypothetical protein
MLGRLGRQGLHVGLDKDLLDLAGQLEFVDDFDRKALRELRHGSD